MRKIIIQDEILDSSDFTLNYVFWLDVPEERQVILAQDNISSSVKDATAEEIDDLRAGKTIETKGTVWVAKGSAIQAIENKLEQLFSAKQQELNDRDAYKYYGRFFDGQKWNEGV